MALTLFYETGREFASEVMDAFDNAGEFHPDNVIDHWYDFRRGNFENPFPFNDDGDIEWTPTAWEVLKLTVKTPKFRADFAEGYRDGMREMRVSRHLAASNK